MLCRRGFAKGAGATLAACLTPTAKAATTHSIARTARVLVGFPAGGVPDAVARLLVEHVQGYAPSMIVENRSGAGGRIALETLKASEPDGSVMALSPVDQLALFPHVYNRLTYRPIEDFSPVATVCSVQFLLAVGPSVPPNVSSLGEFITWCRANPTRATYGTPGAGTHPHFLGSTFARAAGFEFVHAPYAGGPPLAQDLLGGHLTASVAPIGLLLPHVQSGALRVLATTAPHRSAVLPNVPTFKELGYAQLESVERFGVLMPAGTPANVVKDLSSAIRRAVQSDGMRAGLAKLALERFVGSPSEFAQLIQSDTRRWAEVVKASGFKPLD